MKTTSNQINLKDLWIGDTLRILTSGRVGTYEGVGKNGKARVKCGDKIFLVKEANIELIQDGEEAQSDVLESNETQTESIKPISLINSKNLDNNQIDLHIAKLNPELENAHPQMILDHQLVMCRAFIKHAIEKKRNVVTVIHGKGTGALKEEVLHLLKEFSAVRFAISVNDDGAQEVWFKY